MASPFKSTASLASRRRQRPMVERSTFVIALVSDERVAFPVEQVERVVRETEWAPSPERGGYLIYRDHPVRVRALGPLLCGGAATGAPAEATHQRVLIVPGASGAEPYLAWRVDRVYEVFAIETALVQPLEDRNTSPFGSSAVRGYFQHDEHRVWLVDVARLESAQ